MKRLLTLLAITSSLVWSQASQTVQIDLAQVQEQLTRAIRDAAIPLPTPVPAPVVIDPIVLALKAINNSNGQTVYDWLTAQLTTGHKIAFVGTCCDIPSPGPWQANTTVAMGLTILDPAQHVQQVSQAGLTGATIPAFSDQCTAFPCPSPGTVQDNQASWTDLGPQALQPTLLNTTSAAQP